MISRLWDGAVAWSRRRPGWCALACGLLAGLGHAPLSTPVFLLLAAPVMVGLLRRARGAERPLRRGLRLGWAFGFGHFAVTFYWIGFAFLVDAATLALMPVLMAALIGGVALFPGTAGLVFVASSRAGAGPLRSAFLFSGLFGLSELARSYAFGGFPWALHGLVWGASSPVAQSVSLWGVQGLTVITLLAAAMLGGLLDGRGRRRLLGPGSGVALITALVAFGGWRLSDHPAAALSDVTARVVRTQIPQDLKWDPERAAINVRRLLELTAEPAAVSPDIVVWPESSVGFRLLEEERLLDRAVRTARDAALITGTVRIVWRGGDDYDAHNALIAARAGDPVELLAVYDKTRLVPFGEFVPGPRALVDWGLKAVNQTQRAGFTPGTGPKAFDLGTAGRFAPLICYEILFPEMTPLGPTRPDYLVHITNDGWYGKTTGPAQHFEHTRFRAIETGLPIVRSANNGDSGVIDAAGRIIMRLHDRDFSFADARIPSAFEPTLYGRFQDLLGLALALTCAAIGSSRLILRYQKE